jgi:hypothetical protein
MQETLEEIKHTEGQSLDISSLLSAGFFFPSRRLTFDGMSRMGSPSIRLVQAVPTLVLFCNLGLAYIGQVMVSIALCTGHGNLWAHELYMYT